MVVSLRVRFVLLFLACEVALVAVVVAFTASAVRQHSVDLFMQRGQVVALDLAERGERLFRLGLLLDEFLGFENQCQTMVATNEGIARAQLADIDGQVRYDSEQGQLSGVTPTLRSGPLSEATIDGDALLITQPVRGLSGKTEAVVLVEISNAAIDREVRTLLSSILVFSALSTLIGAAIVALFLRQQFWTPIARLLGHIQAINPDDVGHLPLESPVRRDEIGVIGHAFYTLLRTLAHAQLALQQANEQLREQKKTLEERVAARTQELRRVNQELERLATTDCLTELPNRFHFDETLQRRFEHSKRHQHNVALIVLDLNGFKQINDRWGHAAGDATLKIVAQRVAGSLRGGDTFFRLGGDEFALLVEGFDSKQDLQRIVEKLDALISEPFVWQEQTLTVNASIGVAVPDWDHDQKSEQLLRAADQAMYEAKRSGSAYSFTGGIG
jgi:diguanylate cyclase (GGDEF)-like protein